MIAMDGKRVLLVNPWIHDFAAYDLWAKPLGLLSLGGMLREAGCEVYFVDCLNASHPMMDTPAPEVRPGGHHKFYRTIIEKPPVLNSIPRHYARYGISTEAFLSDLEEIEKPDAVLVTCSMTYWYEGAFEAISLIRRRFPEVPVILGGIYATLCPDHARSRSGADFIIEGPGEVPLLELLSELWGLRCDVDVNYFCRPCLDLVPNLTYACLLATRGCPFRCVYCASSSLFDRFIRRESEETVKEVRWWRDEHKIGDFAFYDDALLIDCEELLEKLACLDVRFHCPNAIHAGYITRSVAHKMKNAGFATIRTGLESSDPERQRITGGKVSCDEYERAVSSLVTAGYDSGDIGTYILCGLPGQEAGEVFETIEYVRSLGARPVITEYSPVPGSKLWQDAVACSSFPLAEDPVTHNNTILPCTWEGLTRDDYEAIRAECRR